MVGLRGVGKTVLLNNMREAAEAAGVHTLRMEAPEGRSLPALLAPQLRLELLRLSRSELANSFAERGLRALAGFAKALKVREVELAALITSLHRCAQQKLPIVLVGTGLPQLRGRMGEAKSYAERLFDFPDVGPLPQPAAALAITKPADKYGVTIEDAAVEEIVRETKGYPYFL